MKELGNLSYFLGISITATAAGYVLSQTKYAQDILKKAGLADCKPCSSPISVKPTLPPDAAQSFSDPALYRRLVGALQYLITRPDISLAVNQSCQHMHSPTVGHFAAVKRLLRFVKGTLTHGLSFSPSSFDVHAFSDSNWAAKLMLCPSSPIRLQGDVEDTNSDSAEVSSSTDQESQREGYYICKVNSFCF
ncbi:hypothetical protein CsSME_00047302 [Camellia sinensis var. sinensis]